MRWDEWRGSVDGRPTFWSKTLFRFRGRKVCLHKFVAADDLACLHTHPSIAIRVILWGGYVEQYENGDYKLWLPGMIGIVRPAFCHRVDSLVNGRVSYSLWLRGPITTAVELRGNGWPA